MIDFFITNWWLIPVFIFAISMYVLSRFTMKHKSSKNYPYRKKPFLLTPSEHVLYQALIRYLGNLFTVCPKVGIKDFIEVIPNTKEYQHHFNKISQKHVDFLICDAKSMLPLYGVELDDSSHKRKKVKSRDELVEKIYFNAGFKLIRIPVKLIYADEYLKKILSH